MNALLFLIPISLLMGLTALAACIWSLRSKQNEDPEGAKYRIFGEELIESPYVDPKSSVQASGGADLR
jgi:cbb3-type cytochrome oxidase maturation protein